MQIEHMSRSYRRQIRNRKNVCVRFGGQQDASTSKVSFGQPAQMCHNNPPTSRWVNPSQFYKSQRCSEKVNAWGNKLKVNATAKRSTLWPWFLCQVVRPSKIEPSTSFQLDWTSVDQSQCWSNFLQNPSSRKSYYSSAVRSVLFVLPTCGWNSSSK